MTDRERRQKASDVFASTNFLFGEKTSDFSRAFPDIETVDVSVSEDGEGVRQWSGTRHHDQRSLSEYVNCSNPLCYNGGVNVGGMLRSMSYPKQTELEDTCLCQGYEGSPKGRRKYRECLNSFRVKIIVTYKDSADTHT